MLNKRKLEETDTDTENRKKHKIEDKMYWRKWIKENWVF